MSIITSGFILLIKTLIYISCAPKIGPVLFDPLVYESQTSMKIDDNVSVDTSDNWLTVALRSKKSSEEFKKPCQGYDYDITQCKYVNDRKICGYNKNKGDLKADDITDIGNGCRIRNDRLECGYLIGPFNVSRHPPANVEEPDKIAIEKLRLSVKKSREKIVTTINKTNKRIADDNPDTKSNEDDIELNVRKSNISSTLTKNTITSRQEVYATSRALDLTQQIPTKRKQKNITKNVKNITL